jgi:hypothetical protein
MAIKILPSKQELKIVSVELNKLKEWKNNPRKNDQAIDRLAELLKIHGQRSPIVVWKKNNTIYKGNTTYKAAKKLGWKTIQAAYEDFTSEPAAIAYGISDNKSSEWSEWDDNILKNLMNSEEYKIQPCNIGMSEFDFNKFYNFESEEYESTDYSNESKWIIPKEIILELAYKSFKKIGFILPKKLEIFEMLEKINKLSCTEGRSLLHSTVGYDIADSYNQHRLLYKVSNTPKTIRDAFNIEKDLKKSIEACFDNSPLNLNSKGGTVENLSFLKLVHGVQTCSNFRPGFAKFIYNKYCIKNGIVFDPCMGFGGRLVGFFASHCKKYIACDPDFKTYNANKTMCNDLLQYIRKEVYLLNIPIEEYSSNELYDLAFTSPPYYCKELYENGKQSYKLYNSYEKWRDGFLKQLFIKCYNNLKRNCFFILNIEDVKIKNIIYPLVADSIKIGKEIGFIYEKEEKFQLHSRTYLVNNEKKIIYGQEKILFFKRR